LFYFFNISIPSFFSCDCSYLFRKISKLTVDFSKQIINHTDMILWRKLIQNNILPAQITFFITLPIQVPLPSFVPFILTSSIFFKIKLKLIALSACISALNFFGHKNVLHVYSTVFMVWNVFSKIQFEHQSMWYSMSAFYKTI